MSYNDLRKKATKIVFSNSGVLGMDIETGQVTDATYMYIAKLRHVPGGNTVVLAEQSGKMAINAKKLADSTANVTFTVAVNRELVDANQVEDKCMEAFDAGNPVVGVVGQFEFTS